MFNFSSAHMLIKINCLMVYNYPRFFFAFFNGNAHFQHYKSVLCSYSPYAYTHLEREVIS